jgi:hypothetical protein
MHFFFDLINHVSGYTEKYYDEIADKMNHEDLVKKYRTEKIKYQDEHEGFKKSELLGNHYPHSLMIIEGIQELYKMKCCNVSTLPPG